MKTTPHSGNAICSQTDGRVLSGVSDPQKDKHIKGQARYVSFRQMNNAFMMHASTSPFYPLFAALDVNAKMHEGEPDGVCGRNVSERGLKPVNCCCGRVSISVPLSPLPWTAVRGKRRKPVLSPQTGVFQFCTG